MLLLPFFLLNFYVFFYSKKLYTGSLNPLFVYTVTFSISFFLHEIKLIKYDEITLFCLLVLMVGEILFTCGCVFGKKAECRIRHDMTLNRIITNDGAVTDNKKLKTQLKKWIFILSALSSIAILSGFILLLVDFDFDLKQILLSGQQIYALRLSREKSYLFIPYLASLAYNAIVLSGIYIKKYGLEPFAFLPLLLQSAVTLMTGNRYVVILSIIQFFTAFTLISVKKHRSVRKPKMPLWKKAFYLAPLGILLYVFWNVTESRSSWVTIEWYVSPILASLMDTFGNGVYKIYTYAASPVGVLSAFLKEPYFEFGHSTFAFVYNILERFGWIENVRIARDYYVPIHANTGTYLLAMIADFTVFAPFAVFLWGAICSKVFVEANNYQTVKSISVYAILMSVLAYCFFSWYFAESSIWISLTCSYIVGNFIDRSSRNNET